MIVALAGGVGGAKMVEGLAGCVEPKGLTVVVNCGDDFEHLGLKVCPDLDTVMYNLAGLANRVQGWGVEGDTAAFMNALLRIDPDQVWFKLGDQDLATHVVRTKMLRRGDCLSTVTHRLFKSHGVQQLVLPMSDDSVSTFVSTDTGLLAFQEYFVKLQCRPKVQGFEYRGAKEAKGQPLALMALKSRKLKSILICPSNPWLSIAPILAISDLADAINRARVPKVVISPIIGGQAVKGPAGSIMAQLGLDVSALGIAQHYASLANGIVIDQQDADYRAQIESLGLRVLVTDTIMKDADAKARLAGETLNWIGSWV